MKILRRITFWWFVFAVIFVTGLYATVLRFFGGLGVSTNLSDRFPWGIWIGFDVLCGVGLAAGGFTVAAMVYVFGLERYRPILRPTVLTAFLGYVTVSASLMYDLGLPYRIWHPMVMWNEHSPMFEMALCVMFYTTVLFLEFAPAIFERVGLHAPVRLIHTIILPLVIFGVLLSTLHQSTLGTLFVIAPNKLHGLWYSSLLPVFFYVTAIGAGLSMTVMEAFLSHRAFGTRLHRDLLVGLGKASGKVFGVYLIAKMVDLVARGKVGLVFEGSVQSSLFVLEISLSALAVVLFHLPRVQRSDTGLFYTSLFSICGFVLNRMDVSTTGMRNHEFYFPAWSEIAISIFIIACAFAAFAVAARFLPVFAAEEEPAGAADAAPHGHHGEVTYVPLAQAGREPRRANLSNPTGAGILFGLTGFLLLCAFLLRGRGETPGLLRPFAAAPRQTAPQSLPPTQLASLRLPTTHAFPMGDASPGRVTFSHQTHVAGKRMACKECHSGLFSLVKPAAAGSGETTIGLMRGCSRCHDGGRAFAVKQDCAVCHVAGEPKAAPAFASRGSAPADYSYAPGAGSPGPVVFSHTRHINATGAACSSCHPGRFRMLRPEAAAGGRMPAMHKGHECGGCHNGRTAFTTAKECSLCHQSTQAPAAAPVSGGQRQAPGALRFPAHAGSPGRVTFRHDRHTSATGGKCVTCHPSLFPMVNAVSPLGMRQMHAGRQCGACHDGRKAFTVARDCALCHEAGQPAAARFVSTAQVAPPEEFTYPRRAGSPGSVTFSHLRHVKASGGACSGCHPSVFPMAHTRKVRMKDMYFGKQCGSCHNGGKSFTVAGDCGACHRQKGSKPPKGGTMLTEKPKPPADIAYAPGKGSPGPVVFSHARHMGADCGDCHSSLFPMAKPSGERPEMMAGMYQGENCGRCHDGKSAFTASKDCSLCHRPPGKQTAAR